jgi:serine/threonine protein kinase
MARLLTALAYCHANGVWHRDVKLENLFLMADSLDTVVLGDFGFAIDLSQTPFDWQFLGSPQCAAPEICERTVYSGKVDIWSAGVTLFAMMAGSFPYEIVMGMECSYIAESMESLHAAGGIPILSPECNALLLKMLSINPSMRISAHDAFVQPWFAGLITEMPQGGELLESLSVEVICVSSSEARGSLRIVTFPSDSKVSPLASAGFSQTRMTSITIPPSVVVICEEGFELGASLVTVAFASDSKLSLLPERALSEAVTCSRSTS